MCLLPSEQINIQSGLVLRARKSDSFSALMITINLIIHFNVLIRKITLLIESTYHCSLSAQIKYRSLFSFIRISRPRNKPQILSYAKDGLILISLPSVFGDESEALSLRVSHVSMIRKIENPARDGKGRGRRRRKVKLWSEVHDHRLRWWSWRRDTLFVGF